jgi:hypothetical protein
MKSLYTTLFVLALLFANASEVVPFQQKAPKAQHLKEVNKFWEGKPVSQEIVAFASEADRIQAHLFGVYDYLKSHTPSDLSTDQLEKRGGLLKELKLYAQARSFPKNTGHTERTPYFIDQFNTACAVGNLMLTAGNEDFALFLKENFNFNYIAEMPQKEVALWASNNGFETWELEWIQPSYPYYPTTRFQQKNNQLISPVNKIEYLTDLEMTCYATEGENVYASRLTCVKDDGSFLDYGYYLNGSVLDFEYGFDGKMVAGGAFIYGDSTYGLALLEDPDTRTFWKMPSQEKYITRALAIDGNKLYFSAELSDTNTLIYSWTAGQPFPTQIATINGRVNALENRVTQLYIAGQFTSATNGNGTVSNCNNIVWLQSNILNQLAEGFDGYVNQLRVIDWEVYAVGFCDNINDSTKGSCAQKWSIDHWESLISDSSDIDLSIDSAQIFDIVNYDDTLVFGGNFRISSFSDMWNIDAGRALGVIHADKSVTSKSFINGLVNSLTINGDGLLEIGGDFTSYTYHMPGSTSWIQNAEESLMMAGEIAYGLVGTEEIVNSNDLIVYPNPTSGILNLSSTENIQKVNVYDLKGSLILEKNASQLNAQTLDVSSLKSGVYVIELVDQTGSKLRNEFVVN